METEIDEITSWIEQPARLKDVPAERLEKLCNQYPLFSPLAYFKTVKSKTYNKANLSELYQLFPANQVLVYELFQSFHQDVSEALLNKGNSSKGEKRIHLFPDEALTTSQSGGGDYFANRGEPVATDLPSKESLSPSFHEGKRRKTEKDLMVVMSFSEWLQYLEERRRQAREEAESKSALKAMWQREKLGKIMEDEEEEIPEDVFKMAIDSVAPKEEVISESLAKVYLIQGKKEKALDMFKKLSLSNPEKSAYFAEKIEEIQKDIDL